jgi:hypothetical protein
MAGDYHLALARCLEEWDAAVQGNSPTYTLRRLNRDRPRHCEDAGRTSLTATAHVLRNE